MQLKIKVLPSNQDEWLGWFGDEVIKLRLNIDKIQAIKDKNYLGESLINYLQKDLGINPDKIAIKKIEGNFVHLEVPDIAWELFLSAI